MADRSEEAGEKTQLLLFHLMVYDCICVMFCVSTHTQIKFSPFSQEAQNSHVYWVSNASPEVYFNNCLNLVVLFFVCLIT